LFAAACLQKDVLNAAADAMFDPVAYIDNPESDTQARFGRFAYAAQWL
jgi:hypothetical protein